ncbi:uncharacterized protein LOC142170362 [Nicotiana tabacum]|uniref:Uncharacterized protein LOC142170362 n=1 Tax=Nicotiana tabacum TaxID=4097 RepID=A0AC58STQ8_TOBAC
MRNNEENGVLHSGRLFLQYSVDEFIKVETQRLDFASFNQDLFRIDVLQEILDILRLGEREASKIGKKNFLPTSFTGGPRDMRQRYIDAIALVQYFGKPDIFLTMTCNPAWPETKEHLLATDETQNRPDLVSRVFRAKVEKMKTDILKRNIFGKVAAFMYTIEFQKRGLPHAHFLIILTDDYKLVTPEAYDKFVSAELPDPDANSCLHKLVIKHMMHGHCGYLNPTNSYNTNIEIDEIKEYQSARWVSPPEAMWRLFAFPISEMTPSVYHLQLHLDGLQFVSFKKTDTIDSIVKNPMIKKTMLTEFFLMNETNKDAKQLKLLYKDFPQYFVWSSTYKMWTRRQRGNVIGRVVTCHPTEGERYYLRLLLMNVRGPKSYEDLLTVNGICCDTFRESAEKEDCCIVIIA